MNNNPNQNGTALAGNEAVFRQYLQAVFGYMAGGLVLTGAIAYGAAATGLIQSLVRTPLFWVILLAPLGMVWMLGARLQKMSVTAVQAFFWVFASLIGLSVSTVFLRYTGGSIANVFFITAGTFGAMAAYGYATKHDLSNWGSFLIMGLFGVIIASIVNIITHSPILYFVVSVCGVIVFTGLTAYDVNKIRQIAAGSAEYDEDAQKGAVMGALTLYLDFVNLFLYLLRLLGNRR
jgi:FtsH-binding integral membrane protein